MTHQVDRVAATRAQEKLNFGLHHPMEDAEWRKWRDQKIALFKAIGMLDHTQLECAIDCGAFYGSWTVIMEQIFTKVIAIEPIPESYRCLVKNARRSECINAAVSDKCGELDLFVGFNGLWGRAFRTGHDPKKYAGNPVKSITIDSLNAAPGLIKIDVEGFDYQALKGAEETINKYRPILIVEWKFNMPLMEQLLTEWGYTKVHHKKPDSIWVPNA